VVLAIPAAAVLTPLMGQEATGDVLNVEDTPHEVLLAVYLACGLCGENRDHHRHKAYFDTLPTLSEAQVLFPLFWPIDSPQFVERFRRHGASTRDREGALETFRKAVEEMQKAARQHYDGLAAGCAAKNVTAPCSYSDFLYGWCLVNSRNFNATDAVWSWGSGHCVLLPYADLLNHVVQPKDGGSICEALQWIWNASKGRMEFMAMRGIAPGEELMVTYSQLDANVHPMDQRPPFHFLVYYGFLEQLR